MTIERALIGFFGSGAAAIGFGAHGYPPAGRAEIDGPGFIATLVAQGHGARVRDIMEFVATDLRNEMQNGRIKPDVLERHARGLPRIILAFPLSQGQVRSLGFESGMAVELDGPEMPARTLAASIVSRARDRWMLSDVGLDDRVSIRLVELLFRRILSDPDFITALKPAIAAMTEVDEPESDLDLGGSLDGAASYSVPVREPVQFRPLAPVAGATAAPVMRGEATGGLTAPARWLGDHATGASDPREPEEEEVGEPFVGQTEEPDDGDLFAADNAPADEPALAAPEANPTDDGWDRELATDIGEDAPADLSAPVGTDRDGAAAADPSDRTDGPEPEAWSQSDETLGEADIRQDGLDAPAAAAEHDGVAGEGDHDDRLDPEDDDIPVAEPATVGDFDQHPAHFRAADVDRAEPEVLDRLDQSYADDHPAVEPIFDTAEASPDDDLLIVEALVDAHGAPESLEAGAGTDPFAHGIPADGDLGADPVLPWPEDLSLEGTATEATDDVLGDSETAGDELAGGSVDLPDFARRTADAEGAPHAAVATLLEAVEGRRVPAERRQRTLKDCAVRYNELIGRLQRASGGDPVVRRLRSEAQTALAAGRFDEADSLLSGAEARSIAGLDLEEAPRADRLVVAEIRALRGCLEQTRLDNLRAARHFEAAADSLGDEDWQIRWQHTIRQGNALQAEAEEFAAADALASAIVVYARALDMCPWERSPERWAVTHNHLGNALLSLGEREKSVEKLDLALKSYRLALDVNTREAVPVEWALLQANVGTVLLKIGEFQQRADRFETAAEAFEYALDVLDQRTHPGDWAMTQVNLATALSRLSALRDDAEPLKGAAEAYEKALKRTPRDEMPGEWARTQNALGNVLAELGERTGSRQWIELAAKAYRATLEEWTRDGDPLQWALGSANLGNALWALGEMTRNPALLQEAADTIVGALDVFRELRASHYERTALDNLKALREDLRRMTGHAAYG
ncbi:MAG: tetratricopeptide repeat protein [Hyphomicrobiaceae bacterium]